MPPEHSPGPHSRRRERKRLVKRLRGRPLGDLDASPDFLTTALGASPDLLGAAAAELASMLNGAGFRVRDQDPQPDPEAD